MGLSSRLFCILLFTSACFAQLPISVGVKAGVPLTDSFNQTSRGLNSFGFSNSKNYIVGPMVELRLPLGLSVEADGLFRPYNLALSVNGRTISEDNYNVWEFPIVAKYRFGFPLVKPYIEAGPSFRTKAQAIDYISNKGFTVGAGVDVHALLLHVAPEIRYTRWSGDQSVRAFIPTQSKQDQVEFLVGFSF